MLVSKYESRKGENDFSFPAILFYLKLVIGVKTQ